jgi:flagellar biosynthetic protein FliR
VANLLFAAVSIAGEMADLQSGLAFASLVDPANEERTAIIGQIQMMIAWLVFLAVNGHHVLLRGMSQSFTLLPLGAAALPPSPAGMLSLVSRTFVTAIQIGAPVLGSVLVADIALGLLSRAMPQANLLAVGFPIKMLAAFAIITLSLPVLVSADRNLIPMRDSFLTRYLGSIAGAP